jgi:hypothetical protein
MLNNQYRPKGLSYLVQGEAGEFTEMAFDLPEEMVAHKLGFELTASSATINKGVEQAGLTQLLGILNQNMQAGQQAILLLGNPQIPAEAKEYTMKYMGAMNQVVRRLAASYGEKDSTYLVPELPEPQAPQGAPNGMGQQARPPIPVGPLGEPGPEQLPGPEQQPPGAEAGGNGGAPGEPGLA